MCTERRGRYVLQPVDTGETNDVVFTGALFWYPNVDAVIWFASRIWPLIRREVPVARFAIVGREPAAEVQILGGLSGVEVVPNVADVRPYLARAAVCVAPLRCGGGTRLKILEALASGRPVVSTSVGVAGLELIGGRDLCVVDDPPAFAAACVELLRNSDLRTSLGQAGRRAVEQGLRLGELCHRCVVSVPSWLEKGARPLKLLFVSCLLPYPDVTHGGGVDLFHLIASLATRHEVSLVSIVSENEIDTSRISHRIA